MQHAVILKGKKKRTGREKQNRDSKLKFHEGRFLSKISLDGRNREFCKILSPCNYTVCLSTGICNVKVLYQL